MHASAPRFDWSYNFGHLLTSAAMVVSVGGGIWYTSERLATLEHRLRASEQRAVTYIPLIESTGKQVNTQDERLRNTIEALQDLRTGIAADNRAARAEFAEMAKSVSALREGMAGANAKLESLQRTVQK